MYNHKRLFFSLILALVLVALLWPLAGPAAAQGGGWSDPEEVSQLALPPDVTPEPDERRYGSSWFADLALGPEGSAHVVWYSGIALGGEAASSLDLLMYRERLDGEWSPLNEVNTPATGGYTVRNSMVFGRDGRLHVIYRGGLRLYYMSAPWEEAGSARAWSKPRLLTDGASYYNALAADNAGGLHAFWSEAIIDDPLKPNKICSNCSDLFYRSSLDGGQSWGAETNLSITFEGESRPQVRVDGQNRLHVVWDEGVDWYAGNGVPKAGVYLRSDDQGKTWTAPVRFVLPEAAAAAVAREQAARAPEGAPAPDSDEPQVYPDAVQQTALAIDSDGNPSVVFRGVGNDRVYLQQSQDGGDRWGDPVEIPGVLGRNLTDNNLDIYALAADGADRLHLLMVGFLAATFNPNEPTNPTLLYLSYDGARWSSPEPVVTNDLYPEYPKLQVFNGNQLRAVWFTRSREDLFQSERARYRIWYSERELNAPAVPPLPLFTPVPTAAATATPLPPTPTPAPTPLPASALAAPPMNDRPNWERRSLITVILALLPAVGIIAGFAGIRALIVRARNKG